MAGIIDRRKITCTITIADNGTLSTLGGISNNLGEDPADGILDLSRYAYGTITSPAAWVAADIAFLVCGTRAGTYLPLNDKTGVLVRITGVSTTAAEEYEIPAQVFMAGPFVKIQSTNTASEATVSQTGGPLSFKLCLGT